MVDYREILRLHSLGYSRNQIEASAHTSHHTVKAVLDTAESLGIFLHCETRKADKSGCISFKGRSYDLGAQYAGRTVDVAFDPVNTDTLTIEVAGHKPFQVRERQIQEHVAPRPKRSEPAV